MQINDLNLKKKCSIEEIKRWIGIGSEVEVKRIEEVTSSAETEISLAFSSASWRMNLTICWICLETSASFIFTVTERRIGEDRGANYFSGVARPSSIGVGFCGVDDKM